MACRNLRKSKLARQRRYRTLVVGEAVGVHEHHRDGPDAVGECAAELRPDGVEVGRPLNRAVGAHPLVHLDGALKEHVRLDDVAGEYFRPRLVANAQRVGKASGGE